VIEWLRGLPSPLRYPAYLAGALLAFFVAVGVGAAAAVVVGWPHLQVASGPGGPPDEARTLEERASETTGEAKTLEDTAAESTSNPKNANPHEPPEEVSFVHRATDENSRGDYTSISDPSINGDANAIVLVEPTLDRGAARGATYDHNIGVWYEPAAQRWAIFNQDRTVVPAGTTFKVVVPPASESFVHRATFDNAVGNITYLDNPLTNGKPGAVLSVTQNWNPGGGRGFYNNHPIDVFYDKDLGKWAIFNQDSTPMPYGAAFNVAVSAEGEPTR
jgi:hypothetical protein